MTFFAFMYFHQLAAVLWMTFLSFLSKTTKHLTSILYLFILDSLRMHFGPGRPFWKRSHSVLRLEWDPWDWWWCVWMCQIVNAPVVLWQLVHVWAGCHAHFSDVSVFGERAGGWSWRVRGASWKQSQPRAQLCPMGIRPGTVLFCASWD